MTRIIRESILALALAGVVLAACLPIGLQSLVLHFHLDREVVAGQETTVHTLVHTVEVKLKKRFVRLSGRLQTPSGQLPESIRVRVVSEDLATGRVFNRFSLQIPIRENGSFSKQGKFKKNLPAGTMQTILIEPVGQDLEEDTEIDICVDVARKKELAKHAPCDQVETPGAGGNTPPVLAVTASPTSIPRADNFATVVVIDASRSSDPDGDPLSFAWTVPSGTFVNGTSAADPVIQVTFPGTTNHDVTVVVTDGRGGSTTGRVAIAVVEPADQSGPCIFPAPPPNFPDRQATFTPTSAAPANSIVLRPGPNCPDLLVLELFANQVTDLAELHFEVVYPENALGFDNTGPGSFLSLGGLTGDGTMISGDLGMADGNPGTTGSGRLLLLAWVYLGPTGTFDLTLTGRALDRNGNEIPGTTFVSGRVTIS